MHIFDEPKIDCHAHVIDPAHFPYGKNIAYKPAGQEIGTTAQFRRVMSCYGVKHALLVQPNSGYEGDNSCLLDAIAKGEGRFKGIAIVDLDTGVTVLKNLQAQGIIGVAINPTFHGNEYYRDTAGLMKRLADLDMFLDLQVENDQFLMYEPWDRINSGQGPDRSCRATNTPGRPRPAVLCSHSSIGRHGTSKPEAFRLPEIRPLALSVRGLLAARSRAG
jgi:predicted TIM-barrel fold metal-dependent hydrolase